MSYDEGCYELNIFACSVTNTDANGHLKSYLLDTVFWKKTNRSTVGQTVFQVLNSYDISFKSVIYFDTDNAAYMKKAFCKILQGLYPKAIQCKCLAHVINLVGEAFRHPLTNIDRFVHCFSQ